MTPRHLILSLAGSALLIAGGLSWRASREGEHRPFVPEGTITAATTAEPAQTSAPAGRRHPTRRAVAGTSSELDSALARLFDISLLEDADDRCAAVEAWVEEVPSTQFLYVLEQFSDADRAGLVGQLLVRRWTALDPRAAAEWTEQLMETEIRGTLQVAVALAWAETDVAGALAWARALPSDDNREYVLTQLSYEAARENPVEALQLAVELSPTAARDALILHGIRQWVAVDADAARDWLLQWPESELRQRALADFATVLADHDGDAGARFAIEHPPAGADFERAIIGVIQRWSQHDLPAVQAWIDSFPATPLRDHAMQVVAQIVSL